MKQSQLHALYENSFIFLISLVVFIGLKYFVFNKKYTKWQKGIITLVVYALAYDFILNLTESPSHSNALTFLFFQILSFIMFIDLKFFFNNPFDTKKEYNFLKIKDANLDLITTYPRLTIIGLENNNVIFDSSDIKTIFNNFNYSIMDININSKLTYNKKEYLIKNIKISVIDSFMNYRAGKSTEYIGSEVPYNIQISIFVV